MKIREITSGLQFPEGPIALADGSVVLVEIARGTLSRVTPDGRIHVMADLGGGPNGAAIGPDGAVYVCNNGGFEWHTEADGTLRPVLQAKNYSGGRIERVNLATGKAERLLDAVDGIGLRGPNDLVFDAHGGFYFTDLGKGRAADMDMGAVHYARTDGTAVNVARPLLTPNGVGLSPDGQTLYYAETAGARLWAYDITAPGQVRKDPWPSINGGRMLTASPGGMLQRFDSLAVDALGNVCVATLMHGGISIVSPDGALVSHVPLPDRMTTNICFGGKDRRTAYVTLSGSGKLIAIDDWPIPGLALAHEA
ncbi:MAG TPA: SMP-30/gluconolactonase/LRE family protein [Aquabacterium sp.]|nr:SMP-30/gluconolactonase/LRE family protein [Aquabacterium sp.]HQC97959.1 SMP-30/gluconolactonase/LRE family protein [Aquabacterium sp.]